MSVDTAALSRLLEHITGDRDERDNSKLRLSGAGNCSRQLAYRIVGAKPEEEALGTRVTFAIGHAYHRLIQDWFVAMGWAIPEYLEYSMVDEARRLRGTCDVITERLDAEGTPSDQGSRRVVEIKSIGNLPRQIGGREVDGAFDCLKEPRGHHIDQATCYAQLWNERILDPADAVRDLMFVYVAKEAPKEGVPVKVFTQGFSRRRWERLEAKFARIWSYLDAGEIPPRDFDPFSPFSDCRFCSFKATCLESDRIPDEQPVLLDLNQEVWPDAE